MSDSSYLSRLEPKNGDFVRYVDSIVSRQQQEMLQARGDEASALRESLKSAFQAIETPDKDGDGVSLRDLVGALAGKRTNAQKHSRTQRPASATLTTPFNPLKKLGALFSRGAHNPNALRERNVTQGQSASEQKARPRSTARIVFLERFLGFVAILAAAYITELGITLPGSFVRVGDILIAIAVLLFFHAGILSKRG